MERDDLNAFKLFTNSVYVVLYKFVITIKLDLLSKPRLSLYVAT